MDYDRCWVGRVWLCGAIFVSLWCASYALAADGDPPPRFAALPLTFPEQPPHRTLRVIRFNDYAARYGHRDAALEVTMLRDFAESIEREIEWVDVFRAAEALQKLVDGDGDLSISAIPIDHASDANLRASEPIARQCFRVIGLNSETLDSPLGLAGMSLAVKLSSPMWSYLDRLRTAVSDLRVTVLPDNLGREETLRMLNDGIYDAALVATDIGEEVLADFPRLKVLFDLTGPEPVSWFTRRDNEYLIDRLNEFIKRYHTIYNNPDPSLRTFADIKKHGVLRVITRLDENNYFLKRGRPAGFELELARRFANRHGLRLDVLVGRDDDEIVNWLHNGVGDIVTTRIDARYIHGDPAFSISREYRHDASVLITTTARPIRSAAALRGTIVAGYEGSTHLAALQEFVNESSTVIGVDRRVSMELLLERVAIGVIDAVVINAHRVNAALTTRGNLVAGMSIPNPYRYRWTLRGEDGPLMTAVDHFIQSDYRDEAYNVHERRYVHANDPAQRSSDDISPFDGLLQSYADRYGFDWRLIAAQMYQESHFDPGAISRAGAIGLMQLMPATAESLGFANPHDPESGIHAGIKYLAHLRSRFDKRIPMDQRTWLALAAYNIGFDRVRRARALASESGLNPDKWFGNVEFAMRQMTRADQNSRVGCRCGQAIVYVRRIRSLYYAYRNLVLAMKMPQRIVDPLPSAMHHTVRPKVRTG